MQDGGGEVVRRDGFFAGKTRNFVAGTVNGTAADAAACEETAVAPGVVFTSRIAGCNLRSATEFSRPDHKGVIEHPAVFEIREHGAERLVSRRNQIVFETLKIVAVCVPEVTAVVVPVDRDEGNSVFQQSAGQQHALSMDVAAVAIADGIRFAGEIKGLTNCGCRQQAEGFSLLVGEIDGGGDLIQSLLLEVDSIQQLPAGIQPPRVETIKELQSGSLPAGLSGVAGYEQWVTTAPEPAAGLSGRDTTRGCRMQSLPWEHYGAGEPRSRGLVFRSENSEVR